MTTPIPEDAELVAEIRINPKFTVRLLRHDNGNVTHQRWQALRYDEPWPACPYPEWAPDNLTMAMFLEIQRLREGIEEYLKPENYHMAGRFNPENMDFDAISYATKLLKGERYD